MLCGLIMAGGMGTRFWPLSTEEKPKQFLRLVGKETMLQMTVSRIRSIIDINRIFICTGNKYVDLVKEQISDLPERNIIVEPEGRNTAPCIALSSLIINKFYEDSNILVLPSDHLIKEEELFREIVEKFEKLLGIIKGGLVTFGMVPTRPEIGYGYIKTAYKKESFNSTVFYKVEEFIEKPNKEKAEKYLNQGNYLWNSGMFLWNGRTIIEKIKTYLPNTYEALKGLEDCKKEDIYEIVNRNYGKTDKISIDFGILEKSTEIYVVPTEVGWDDVGNWEAVERYTQKDEKGNIHIGNIKNIEGTNNLIIASNQKVTIDGLSNIYVVESNGQIIIGPKENVNNIKLLK